jgi:hypothetical protein
MTLDLVVHDAHRRLVRRAEPDHEIDGRLYRDGEQPEQSGEADHVRRTPMVRDRDPAKPQAYQHEEDRGGQVGEVTGRPADARSVCPSNRRITP